MPGVDSFTHEQNQRMEVMEGVLAVVGVTAAAACIAAMVAARQVRATQHRLIIGILVSLIGQYAPIAVVSFAQLGRSAGHSTGCVVCGFVLQFFAQATIFFVLLFTVHLYRKIVKKHRHTGRSMPLQHWFVWTFAALNAFLPLTTGGYGATAGYYCWLRQPMWVAVFYVPVVIYFVAIIVLYSLIFRALAKSTSRGAVWQAVNKSFILFFYPILFIGLRLPAIISRFDELSTGSPNYNLYFAQYFFNGLIPTAFVALYATQQLHRRHCLHVEG